MKKIKNILFRGAKRFSAYSLKKKIFLAITTILLLFVAVNSLPSAFVICSAIAFETFIS